MRYGTFGMLGYGLQFALYVAFAVTSTFFPTSTYQVRGLNPSGFLTPVPGFLISLAWFYAGRDKKSGLFIATAIVGILGFVSSIASALWYSIYAPPIGVQPSSPAFLASILGLVFLAGLIGLLAITYFVLETISFFTAGRLFQDRKFKFAGWSRIFALIAGAVLVVVAIVFGLLSLLTSIPSSGPTTIAYLQVSPTPGDQFVRIMTLSYAGFYLVLTIPEAFAFLGFREIRRSQSSEVPLQPATPAQGWQGPPAPPAIFGMSGVSDVAESRRTRPAHIM